MTKTIHWMGHVINGKADGYGTLMTIKGAEYVGHVKDGLDVVGENDLFKW